LGGGQFPHHLACLAAFMRVWNSGIGKSSVECRAWSREGGRFGAGHARCPLSPYRRCALLTNKVHFTALASPLRRWNARSCRWLPPYRPYPPRALAPGPLSGKRDSGTGLHRTECNVPSSGSYTETGRLLNVTSLAGVQDALHPRLKHEFRNPGSDPVGSALLRRELRSAHRRTRPPA